MERDSVVSETGKGGRMVEEKVERGELKCWGRVGGIGGWQSGA